MKTQDSKTVAQNLSLYGKLLKEVGKGIPHANWEPLRRWPAVPHPEQARIDEFLAIPSRWNHE